MNNENALHITGGFTQAGV